MSRNDDGIVSMEEGRAEPIVEEQANETTRGNDQITEQNTPSLCERIQVRLKSLHDDFINNTPMIPRVPIGLRENDNLKKYFEPRVVSIGPYHHENSNLMTKEMKLELAAMFIEKHIEVDKSLLSFKYEMNVKKFRECYELEATQRYNDEDLARMFLIDGCAVLHFLHSDTHVIEQLGIDKNTLYMDLLLLENQLPYQVLKMLMSSSKDRDDLMSSIEKFIRLNACTAVEENQKKSLITSSVHLLDLMRKTDIAESVRNSHRMRKSYMKQPVKNNENSSFMGLIFNKLSIFLSYLFSIIKISLYRILRTKTTMDVQNMQELTLAGIELKPTSTASLADITFRDGTLKLPCIEVDNSTAFKFLNLIAYEIGSNSSANSRVTTKLGKNFPTHYKDPTRFPAPSKVPTPFKVSSYIFFLTSLITRVQDVNELQVNKILNNKFASNEEVVQLFKEIRSVDFPESFRNLHSKILDDIKKYLYDPSKFKFNVWRALFRNRFSIFPVVRLFVRSDHNT